MPTILEHLFRHNRWANRLMVQACLGLSDSQLDTAVEGTYGSLRDTLTHIAGAESGYAFRLTGEPRLMGREDPFPGVDGVLEVLEKTGAALERVAVDLDVKKMVEVSGDDGVKQVPAFVVLLQAANHATDHRSHIATILSQIGRQPPDLDLWSYDDAGLSRN